LQDKAVFPLVALIEQAGIPFADCSAYVDALINVYPEVAGKVCVSKPVTIAELRDAVLGVLSPRIVPARVEASSSLSRAAFRALGR
jgi:hypothetical protein